MGHHQKPLERSERHVEHPHTKSSVLYFVERAFARCMRSARSALLRFGGGAVRLSTTSPTSMKNSSCPAGVHMQSRRAGLSELFLKAWGAFAGMFTVDPALALCALPRKVSSISPSRIVNISSKS